MIVVYGNWSQSAKALLLFEIDRVDKYGTVRKEGVGQCYYSGDVCWSAICGSHGIDAAEKLKIEKKEIICNPGTEAHVGDIVSLCALV